MSAPSAAIARSAACARLGGRAVHQHVGVLADQAHGGGADDQRDEQRGDRVALVEAGVDEQQADEHGERAGHVAGEVKGVRAQRGAREAARDAQRDERAAEIDERARRRSRRTGTSGCPGGARVAREVPDRFDGDEQPPASRIAASPSAPEVLGAAVAVGVLGVGRAPAEAHGEERQHGGDDVAAGLDPGRDQAEAAGGQADAELQRDEQRGGGDRDERRAPRA